jgi:hypothetical protein
VAGHSGSWPSSLKRVNAKRHSEAQPERRRALGEYGRDLRRLGSTYFGIAIAIETMPAFLMAATRFTIAGLILIAFDLLRHPEARRKPTRRQLLDSFIVGALLLGVGNGLVVFG